jgi:sugar phosphate isomerase/epimerase
MDIKRRDFLKVSIAGAASTLVPGWLYAGHPHSNEPDLFFDISLAEWSLHRSLFDGDMTNLDFPSKARRDFDIGAVEYVNQFFKDKARDKSYLKKLLKRSKDHGVQNLLIMVDGEGDLGTTDSKALEDSIQNHHKWVDAASLLGCHSIRVNARGKGPPEEVAKAAVEGLSRLTEYAAKQDINVVVENHGGYSSNAGWLTDVIERVDHPRCGTLPDFGNFQISEEKTYDRYRGVRQMMPYARGVSAKSYDFDEQGRETTIDFEKMLEIIKDAGYPGHIGIEYEGDRLSEAEGIKATKQLLTKIGKEL